MKRPQVVGWLFILLISMGDVVATSNTISVTTARKADVQAVERVVEAMKLVQTNLSDNKPKSLARKQAINTVASIFLIAVLVLTFFLFVVLFKFSLDVYQHSVPAAKSGFYARNNFEKYVVPIVLVVIYLVEAALFLGVTKPPYNSDYPYESTYFIFGVIGLFVHGLILVFNIWALRNVQGDRASAYGFLVAVLAAFLIILLAQTFVAMMLGQWSPQFDGQHTMNITISNTMAYLGGAGSATFGLTVLSAFLPYCEILVFYRKNTGFSAYGRGLRVITTSLASSFMLLVALAPLETENMRGLIQDETAKRFANLHFLYAGVAFFCIELFLIFATLDSCQDPFEDKCQPINWAGLIVGSAAFLGLLTTVMIKLPSPEAQATFDVIFALSEYGLIASLPLALLARFTRTDQIHIRQALASHA